MNNSKRVWKVNVDGVQSVFTRHDVIRYFSMNHGMSGMRSFGSVTGDWRMIDNIAQDAKAYFDS